MPPTNDPGAPPPAAPPQRRVVFPWVWVGLLVGARLLFQRADVTVDFKTLATMGVIALSVIGVCFWYALRGRAPLPLRLAVAAAPFLFGFAFNALFEARHGGDGWFIGFHRRGAVKPDERLAATAPEAPQQVLDDWGPGENDFPRFLGAGPWAEATGPPLAPDWQAEPPVELWRRPVGAGWSAFAIVGRYALTQEQRGDQEIVSCHHLLTGEPAWSHADTVRFDPADFAGQMGRTGPRATPTVVGDRVFTQGATGLVNCLDAHTGDVVWRVDTAERYGADVPIWGKSGSPLFVPSPAEGAPDLVVVNVGAPAGSEPGSYDASLVAFDASTGDEVWTAGWRQTSYASPQLATLHGVPVVLQTSDDLFSAHDAQTGRLLFDHPWSGQSDNSPSCSQPLPLAGDRLLLTKGYGHGASLLQVVREGDAWSVEPRWSPAVRPVLQTKFCNAVARDGYAYALNGTVLQCVEIDSGRLVWKERRRPSFGFGQLMLAGERLLLLTEQGELVLADASPEGYRERSALQALDEAETCWNTPALAGDVLLVRNSVEAVAYRLPLAGPGSGVARAPGPAAPR